VGLGQFEPRRPDQRNFAEIKYLLSPVMQAAKEAESEQ